MNNIQKEVIIGFFVGIIANTVGILIAAFIIGAMKDSSFINVIEASVSEGFIGKLMSLGAILNLIAFFGFLRIKRDYRARGVMVATVLTALVILYFKVF